MYLLCVVPQRSLILCDLIYRYTDVELVEHLKASEVSLRKAKEGGLIDEEEGEFSCSSWWDYSEAHQDW